MMNDDAELESLWAQAAFSTSWPTLHLFASGESAAQAKLRELETRLGPLSQADLIEPYGDEDWELRVTLPELEPEAWLELSAVESLRGVQLRPGLPTGARFALDCLALDFEEGPGLARRTFLGEDELRRVLLRGREPDEDSRGLEQELVDAYRRVNPALYMESDRGMDTAELVLEPLSGRFGLRLCFPHEALAIFEDLGAARAAIFREMEGVIRARSTHKSVRLWPRIEWSSAAGLECCLWMIGPTRAAYPGDIPQAAGRSLPLQLGRAKRVLELLLVPQTPADHLPLATATAALIDASEFALSGGWPRWILGRDGVRRFALGWTFSPEHLDHARAVLAWAERRSDVCEVRVVPGPAPELEADWQQLDPVWYGGNQRSFVICRDLCVGRDRAVTLRTRTPDSRESALLGQSYPACVEGVQPVETLEQRPALLWRMNTKAWSQAELLPLLAQLDGVAPAVLGPVLDLGFDRDGGFVIGWPDLN